MTMAVRAALYLRVSTGRQADNDLSIPDQRHQAKDIAHRAAGRLLPTRSSPAFPRRTIADRNSSA
jgi:hypothetical protein